MARDFPLDDAATGAAMVARCSGTQYFAVTDRLLHLQASWAFSSDWTSPLKQIVAPLGIGSDVVDACLADQALRNGILDIRQDGMTTYGVTGTPSFFINGTPLVGAQPYDVFAAAITAALPH